MSDYVQQTDFSAKDDLPSGDPNKLIRGSDFDTELAAIETAIESKEDAANKGEANGYAELDSNVLVPLAQIPTLAGTSKIAMIGFEVDNFISPEQFDIYDSAGGAFSIAQIGTGHFRLTHALGSGTKAWLVTAASVVGPVSSTYGASSSTTIDFFFYDGDGVAKNITTFSGVCIYSLT